MLANASVGGSLPRVQRPQEQEPNRRKGGTYIVAAENTNDFAVAVELAEDPLLHVLQSGLVSWVFGGQTVQA